MSASSAMVITVIPDVMILLGSIFLQQSWGEMTHLGTHIITIIINSFNIALNLGASQSAYCLFETFHSNISNHSTRKSSQYFITLFTHTLSCLSTTSQECCIENQVVYLSISQEPKHFSSFFVLKLATDMTKMRKSDWYLKKCLNNLDGVHRGTCTLQWRVHSTEPFIFHWSSNTLQGIQTTFKIMTRTNKEWRLSFMILIKFICKVKYLFCLAPWFTMSQTLGLSISLIPLRHTTYICECGNWLIVFLGSRFLMTENTLLMFSWWTKIQSKLNLSTFINLPRYAFWNKT